MSFIRDIDLYHTSHMIFFRCLTLLFSFYFIFLCAFSFPSTAICSHFFFFFQSTHNHRHNSLYACTYLFHNFFSHLLYFFCLLVAAVVFDGSEEKCFYFTTLSLVTLSRECWKCFSERDKLAWQLKKFFLCTKWEWKISEHKCGNKWHKLYRNLLIAAEWI